MKVLQDSFGTRKTEESEQKKEIIGSFIFG
jgi:hypothetical protein